MRVPSAARHLQSLSRQRHGARQQVRERLLSSSAGTEQVGARTLGRAGGLAARASCGPRGATASLTVTPLRTRPPWNPKQYAGRRQGTAEYEHAPATARNGALGTRTTATARSSFGRAGPRPLVASAARRPRQHHQQARLQHFGPLPRHRSRRRLCTARTGPRIPPRAARAALLRAVQPQLAPEQRLEPPVRHQQPPLDPRRARARVCRVWRLVVSSPLVLPLSTIRPRVGALPLGAREPLCLDLAPLDERLRPRRRDGRVRTGGAPRRGRAQRGWDARAAGGLR